MDITQGILDKKGIDIFGIASMGKGLLSRMMSLILIGDMASFYLAIMNNVDPTPVERIKYLKNELAKESV